MDRGVSIFVTDGVESTPLREISRLLAAGGVVAAMHAGWLTGRRVAGAYESIPSLLKGGVQVVDDNVVEDLPWITARSYLDLAGALRMGFGFGAYANRRQETRRGVIGAH